MCVKHIGWNGFSLGRCSEVVCMQLALQGVVKQLSCYGIKVVLSRTEEILIHLLLTLVKHTAEFCILNDGMSERV